MGFRKRRLVQVKNLAVCLFTRPRLPFLEQRHEIDRKNARRVLNSWTLKLKSVQNLQQSFSKSKAGKSDDHIASANTQGGKGLPFIPEWCRGFSGENL